MNINDIDTRLGTKSEFRFSNGNTLPLTGIPFGLNYFTVQNDGSRGSWFFDPDSRRFEGFRLTHQPSPWIGDFQHLQILPINLNQNTKISETAGSFDNTTAIFAPNQLQLHDLRYDIESQLIPSTYGAILTSHHAESNNSGVQFELPGKFDLALTEHEISGWISNFSDCEDPEFKMYVVFNFSQPLNLAKTRLLTDKCDAVVFEDVKHITGTDLRLCVFYDQADNTLQLASSFISVSQAKLNLKRQLNKDVDQQLSDATAQWQNYCQRIAVNDRQHHARVKTFYTMLYRMLLFPQKFYELDENQQPIHYDTKARTTKSGYLYTNNGFWDTYKTVYPFFSIIAPELLQEMLKGFLNSYRESGFLPKWLSPDERGMMPGTLIDAVIADAARKDLIESNELEEFLTAMVKSATVQSADPKYGRRGTLDYLQYGYVPNTHDESVNNTLDYAYSDYCISVVADKLGHIEIADKYRQSALNYQNIFDSETGFVRPKDTKGHFEATFSPIEWGHGYTEGSAWQNGFAVYQDIAGLSNLYGGTNNFYQKLVELVNTPPKFDASSYGFEIHEISEMVALNFGQLAMSNQPSFHIPYLFTYAKHPEMTQLLDKQLMLTAFNDGPTGLPGDEDNGSMAGWYILSALGFYPVTPGSGEYVLGMPLFDEVILHLPNGKTFKLQTKHNFDQNQFVKARCLNGVDYHLSYVTQEKLMAGGQLTVDLSLAPNPRTLSNAELPYSISQYID
ncbi:GH92 family glycosyl hydrolase [Lapidilactobacillus bayanensis]|uniref:GH92 family glycosyl hydrolase n=1 Tax=Lapidilactobacillus bayanensis TaxID=2485998 RepID=UPI000F77439C|nr:GH92 family glycosyl hydrolase [Lapidilactobacillus bayanensis]